MFELRVGRRIWFVASSRNVEIVQLDLAVSARDGDANVAGVVFAAELSPRFGCEWDTGHNRDAVIAALSVDSDVLISEPLEGAVREIVGQALDFLKAENVRRMGAQKTRHQPYTQSDRVDVPGSYAERQFGPLCALGR